MIYYRNECELIDYEFEDILKVFFLKDEVVKINGPWEHASGPFLFCSFTTGFEKGICLQLRDGDFKEELNIPFPSDLCLSCNEQVVISEENREYLKAFRKLFKRQFYKLLQKYTGKVIPWGVMTGIRPTKLANELLDKGLNKDQSMSTLVNDYYVTKSKAELLYNVSVNQRDLFRNSDKNSVSLYIGIPFCPTRCLYCSFSSSTIGQYKKYVNTYIDVLLKEIEHTAGLLEKNGLKPESIYIGGGTPTSINAEQLRTLLKGVEGLLDLGSLREYTLEAGRPDTIDSHKLEVIKQSRVSRISINPQSMNASTLERIGRNHSPAEVESAFLSAREMGFDNINMDVICGLPGEDLGMFLETMGRISQLMPDSLTVHTMAIKRASRLTTEMDNYNLHKEYEQVAGMVEAAHKYASLIGLEPYYLYRQKNMLGNLENVGYSKRGKECLYNIQIMEERQSIFACGAGAVTKIVFPNNRIERSFNVKSVEEYLGRIDEMLIRKESILASL